ncbi:MAG: hypothetical protein KME23_14170 [Goleter apudmare HA4340-LM2]|nr:hypothetical protein [Goleter apudmare HA4340-LM2]
MKSFSSKTEKTHVVEVNWADRWQVYQRLQELDIPCWCQANQPLRVEIDNPTAAVQFWNVTRQFTATREDLIWTLEQSWRSRYRQF